MKRSKPTLPHRAIIGWRENIDLPAWGITGLCAKSDTGARSCAIDATKVEELPDGCARFTVILDRRNPQRAHVVVAPIVGRTLVRSSNGRTQQRLRVRTTVRVGPHEKEVDFTLVDRRRMLHRALLGRGFLQDDFLVDAARAYLHGGRPADLKPKRARKRQKVPHDVIAPLPVSPEREGLE